MKMDELQVKLEQMKEMLEAIQTEFFDEDGSHYGMIEVVSGVYGWTNWLDMANDALGFYWTKENMIAMAKI
jgi:hypothetical protein